MIIFLYGEDSFRSHLKLLGIKNKYLASDKSGSGLSLFDFSENVDSFKVINVFETSNLLAPKRLVIVKKIISSSADSCQKSILEFLKKKKKAILEDKNLVVVFWEDNMPKKNSALFKFLLECASSSGGKKQNYEKLTDIKIYQWIMKRIGEIDEKASISKAALQKLVLYVGSDTAIMDKELQKLVNFSGKNMISEKDVDFLVNASLDNNIFATIDAIGMNNKKEALLALHNHLKKGDDPFYLFSMLLYQFRNLLKIADLREDGISSEYEISKITKIHPYVIKKSLNQIRNFSFSRLKDIYSQLGEMDNKIKTGKLDIRLALDKFVAEL